MSELGVPLWIQWALLGTSIISGIAAFWRYVVRPLRKYGPLFAAALERWLYESEDNGNGSIKGILTRIEQHQEDMHNGQDKILPELQRVSSKQWDLIMEQQKAMTAMARDQFEANQLKRQQ